MLETERNEAQHIESTKAVTDAKVELLNANEVLHVLEAGLLCIGMHGRVPLSSVTARERRSRQRQQGSKWRMGLYCYGWAP